MRRPALQVSLLYISGILLAHYEAPSPGILSALVAVLAVTAFLLRPKRTWEQLLRSVLLYAMLVASSAPWYLLTVRTVPLHHIGRLCDGPDRITVIGDISSDPDVRARYSLITISADSVRFPDASDNYPSVGSLLVRLDKDISTGGRGDRVELSGHIRSPKPARNPGTFDAWAYYSGRGIYAITSVRDASAYQILKIGDHLSFHDLVVCPLKGHIESTINNTLSGPQAALLKGILLGQRRQLPEELLNDFSTIGLTHILAVSGLHVGIITLVCMTLFSVLRLPRGLAVGATLSVLLLYAFITNLTPSVVRASVMAGVFLIGDLLNRPTDSVNTLSVSAILILVIWPQALFSLGFQLSFAATFAIIVGYSKLKKLLPAAIRDASGWWMTWIRDGLAVSLAAQIGTAPIIAFSFFQTAWVAPLGNLIMGPLVFLTTTLGVLSVITAPLGLELASTFGSANWAVLEGMIQSSSILSEIPGALVYVEKPALWAIVLHYAFFLLLILPANRSYRWLAAVIPPAFLAIWFGRAQVEHQQFEVTMIDVGQGDAILIRYPDGYTMLVDGGPFSPNFDAGARIILPFLRATGNLRLDTVLVSHPHTDHYDGLPEIAKALDVGRIVNGGVRPNSRYYRYWRKTAADEGIPVHSVSAGDTLRGYGKPRGMVIHPSDQFQGSPAPQGTNNASVVFRVQYGSFSILLTGDAEHEAEEAILSAGYELRSNVLKSGHHGSRTSSSEALVKAVGPDAVIVSVGERNKFRHPASEVMRRYERNGAKVFRTDRGGAITIRSTGTGFTIAPFIGAKGSENWVTRRYALDSICLTGFPPGSIFPSVVSAIS